MLVVPCCFLDARRFFGGGSRAVLPLPRFFPMEPRSGASRSGRGRRAGTIFADMRALAKITVQNSEVKPYDQTAISSLMEIRISETFSGDIDGEPTVRALQVQCHDKSASMVSLQRFCGKLAGREGSFVLQGSEIVDNGIDLYRNSGTLPVRALASCVSVATQLAAITRAIARKRSVRRFVPPEPL